MEEIPDWLQRMLTEHEELSPKVQKLYDFINSSKVFVGLDEKRKELLRTQYRAMSMYEDALNERIELEMESINL